jgi:Protein of unknown function (DUF3106)
MNLRRPKIWLLFLTASLALSALPARAQSRAQVYRAAAAQRRADRLARQDAASNDAISADNGDAGQKSGAKKGQPNLRSMEGLPPKWIEQLRDRSPEEQQRFMENNERFKSLPPERQAQIRRNLEQWNKLSPEQKNAIIDRERFFESLSPQQRQYIRNTLLPRWQALPFERRQILLGRLRVLRDLSPEARAAKLNDSNFMQGLSPDEQQTLRDLNQLRSPLPPQ